MKFKFFFTDSVYAYPSAKHVQKVCYNACTILKSFQIKGKKLKVKKKKTRNKIKTIVFSWTRGGEPNIAPDRLLKVMIYHCFHV